MKPPPPPELLVATGGCRGRGGYSASGSCREAPSRAWLEDAGEGSSTPTSLKHFRSLCGRQRGRCWSPATSWTLVCLSAIAEYMCLVFFFFFSVIGDGDGDVSLANKMPGTRKRKKSKPVQEVDQKLPRTLTFFLVS